MSSSTGKIILGVVAGAAAGAVAGILLAPAKGSETRQNIIDKGEGYADDVKDKFDEILATLKTKFNGVRHDAEEVVAKGKAKAAEATK